MEQSGTARRRRGPQARDSRSERVNRTENSQLRRPAADSPLPAKFVLPTAQSGHDGGTCTRDPQLCRLVPWLLGHVVIEKKTAAQVTRREKTSLASVLNDHGLRLVEPAGFAPAPGGVKVRCATVEHHSSEWCASREPQFRPAQDLERVEEHPGLQTGTAALRLRLAPTE